MFLALGFGIPTPTLAAQLPIPIYASSTAEDIIRSYAIHYGVSGNDLFNTLKCESNLFPDRKGDYMNGIPTSFGLAQIHLSAHPEVTREEALDPMFSIEFAAKAFSEGHARWWTCYRNLFGTPAE